ncbi:hypothetical protein SAY86_013196 [Trapa natans]|uniref:Uncharacterized protein n=1 Tax=Trapa natans TaxID=22666 RepID=A0AAN7MBC5_TRANT|nr:hypothetical protein SAY86_013196 [Trapa natans]
MAYLCTPDYDHFHALQEMKPKQFKIPWSPFVATYTAGPAFTGGWKSEELQPQGHKIPSLRDALSAKPRFGGTAASVLDPLVGMIGEMALARMSNGSGTSIHAYSSTYHHGGSSSPRLRRHMMQADEEVEIGWWINGLFMIPIHPCYLAILSSMRNFPLKNDDEVVEDVLKESWQWKIVVPNPDVKGRQEILELYLRDKSLADDVDVKQ